MDKRRKSRKKKNYTVPVVLAMICVIAACGLIVHALESRKPSSRAVDASSYFGLESANEIAIVTERGVAPEPGVIRDGVTYVPYTLAKEYITENIYYDPLSDILTTATPVKIINAGPEDDAYYAENGQLFVSLPWIAEYNDIEVKEFTDPARAVVRTDFMYPLAEVTAETEMRQEPDMKSGILCRPEPGTFLTVLDDHDVYARVMTEDGFCGFVPRDALGEKTESAPHVSPQGEYTHILLSDPINMAFHQIYTYAANDTLGDALTGTSGINVIAPTWFFLDSESGEILDLSDSGYTERAHARGMKVFAVANDFDGKLSSYNETQAVLSSTPVRQLLGRSIVEAALAAGVDGINIDYEKVSEDAADAYLMFLRELSALCRTEGLILSADSYVPQPYNQYLRRDIQAEILDYVVTMAYDEHFKGSEKAGSVSSISWVEQAVTGTLEQVPAEQTIIAIPFYTRLWEIGADDKVTSTAMGMAEAAEYVKEHSMKLTWNEETKQNIAELGGPTKYMMWMEDVQSIAEKMKVIRAGQTAGVAEWKLTLEDPEVWPVISGS